MKRTVAEIKVQEDKTCSVSVWARLTSEMFYVYGLTPEQAVQVKNIAEAAYCSGQSAMYEETKKALALAAAATA
jgi:hypothetical protein